MRVIKNARLCYIESFESNNEMYQLKNILTFEENEEIVELLFFDEKLKQYYFFAKLIDFLKTKL